VLKEFARGIDPRLDEAEAMNDDEVMSLVKEIVKGREGR
jgi:hypothetical protein